MPAGTDQTVTTTTTSAARVAANRRNAQRSTGPTTPAGKARARANAIKHGLTGAGVALPNEVREQVEARFLQLQDELAPADTVGTILVSQLALMSVRLDRAARHEAASLAHAVARAEVEYDLARQAEVDHLFETITDHPGANHRRLLTMPEGIDRLVAALTAARDQAATGKAQFWQEEERGLIEAFCGRRRGYFPIVRNAALLAAMGGDSRWLAPDDPILQLKPKEQAAAATQELVLGLDAEITHLVARRATFDPEALARDRAAATHRALIQPGPQAAAAHRYEATAARGFHRTLRDFRAHSTTLEPDDLTELTPLPPAAEPSPTPLPEPPTTEPEPPLEPEPEPVAAIEPEPIPEPPGDPGSATIEPIGASGEPSAPSPRVPIRQNEPNASPPPAQPTPAWGQVGAGADRGSSVFVPHW